MIRLVLPWVLPWVLPLLLAVLSGLAACAPRTIPAGPPLAAPALREEALVMPDGARLPLHVWRPEGPPRAVLLGLHGFGDTAGNAFRRAAEPFLAAGLIVYAYDQRGFGAAPHRGVWAGAEALAADAAAAARLLRQRHPGLPFFLLGESMGGAVAMLAASGAEPLPVDGLILVAPALEGRADMSWLTRQVLELAAHTVPLLEFRNAAPGFAPTDNEEAMRGWSRDPLTYKEVRVDTLYGLIGLMDAAKAAAPRLGAPLLVLYGARDRIISPGPVRGLLRALPPAPEGAPEGAARHRAGYYATGYHMLLRDKGRDAVAADVLAWMADPAAPLPSGADRAAEAWMGRDR
ncbi:alpha/beta fold hydrolase [Pseudoroseomonas sp. WGS1072]|uniref:alpha/beta fold hydrolase n=1 Tax=Roseomonas sp. WGS1072 TaxID=3366816 RepID=UPI003BF227E0